MRALFLLFGIALAGVAYGQEAPAGLPPPVLSKLSRAEIEAQPSVSDAESVGPQNVDAKLAAAWKYLLRNSEKYRISPDASNLKLVTEKSSLLGSHYHFNQVLGGIEVDSATLVVTVNQQGQVTKVYTSMVPVTVETVARASKATVASDRAFDTAWNLLGAQERELYSQPVANLKYIATGTGFRLVYAVDLHIDRKRDPGDAAQAIDEPGYWRVLVDAVTGEPIGEPIRLSTDHKGEEGVYEKRAGDRSAAFEQYFKKEALKQSQPQSAQAETLMTGSGNVFDPDPRTTLKNASLSDSSSAVDFDGAYQNVPLLELASRNGKCFLEGPWVRLEDFELPAVAPSSTANGKWTQKRADPAFNDVMTYFHIDRSQRYIQSLGFMNVQAGPIRVDSNGLNGADNSHYIPATNTLAFGHGCVDDNEDADVILHEYGHAMTYSINSQWFGGDSGAIGEGFGDYWAETSSFASPNGATFQTFQTFDWDASSGCWPGRRLDVKASDVTYDPNKRYAAHQTLQNGVQSDELWATPLYQAHVELRNAGVPREEIDKVVIQAMFGIGSGFTMRQLAENVVDTANTLFPMGTHASVFEKHFKQLKILP